MRTKEKRKDWCQGVKAGTKGQRSVGEADTPSFGLHAPAAVQVLVATDSMALAVHLQKNVNERNEAVDERAGQTATSPQRTKTFPRTYPCALVALVVGVDQAPLAVHLALQNLSAGAEAREAALGLLIRRQMPAVGQAR